MPEGANGAQPHRQGGSGAEVSRVNRDPFRTDPDLKTLDSRHHDRDTLNPLRLDSWVNVPGLTFLG
jgi:hypothetical protein